MHKIISILKNENGSIIALSAILLSMLAVIGIASINTTSVELQIAGNERAFKESLYNADGAIRAVFPVIDDIRYGKNPADFNNDYSGHLTFVGGGEDFWDEQPDDGDCFTSSTPDIKVVDLGDAKVDVDRLQGDPTGGSVINRAGYEGLGKGGASGWVFSFMIRAKGSAGGRSASELEANVDSVR